MQSPRPARLARADAWQRRGPPRGEPRVVGVLGSPAPLGADPPGADSDAAAALGRERGPLRCVLATLAGRFVAVRGWEPLGYARLGDWARERVGLSARTLQDLARVDAQLAALSAAEAALGSGALPWSKVRLVARVATPADERRWLALAQRIAVGALEREVRALDVGSLEAGAAAATPTDEDGAPEEERACLQLRCTQLARRVAGEAFPPWQALECITAELLSAFPLEGEPDEAAEVRAGSPVRASDAASRGAATLCAGHASMDEGIRAAHEPEPAPATDATLPPALASFVADLDHADAFELDARLCLAVAREQGLEARLGEHLRRVAAGRIHRTLGLPSLERYARERLGISPRRARGLLRLARAERRWPQLHAAWRSGRLSWAKAQTLLPALAAAAPEEAPRWIERACGGTLRRLEQDVELREREDPEVRADRQDCAQPRASEAGMEREDPCRVLCWGPADAIRLVRATLCSLRRRIERATGICPSEGDAFEAMLDHAMLAWGGGEERVRRAWRVFARDGWRCTVPGCSSYRNLHDHHVVFRSAGGSDAEENRTTLCAWHHLRGVHAGRVRITGRAPRRLRFELGLREGRGPLLVYGAGERLESSASRISASVVKSRGSTSGSSRSISTVTSVSVPLRRFETEMRRGTE